MNARLEISSKDNINTLAQTRPIAPDSAHILLVDDDIYIQELYAGALIRSGYDVETADDGADAWQALNSRSSHYDLLITDNAMPRITGLELVKKLRSAGMTLPVILMPETVSVEGFELHQPLPFDAILPKPFTTTVLVDMVEKVLRAVKSAADSARRFEGSHSKYISGQPARQKGASLQIQTKFPRRILVVDDEPLIRQLCAELLNDPGYEVDTAENGAVAWNALRIKKYDLLITDHEMPQLSGIELVMKLRTAHMTLPVIMVSGRMPVKELRQHPELHIDAALLKPFKIQEFADVVKNVLHAAGSATNNSRLFGNQIMADDEISQAEKPANATIPDQINPPYRILVVDDDGDTRQISINVLVNSGYEVEGVTDGAAGWEALQAYDYDLIVTDNKMPRMTGVEMLEKIRAARMSLPVIMATGNLPTHEFERRPWLKPDLMLQRPFSNDDLLAAIKKVLGPDDGRDDLKESLLPKYL
ncbi:MAG: response regulator [Limisphaerales bacterium]